MSDLKMKPTRERLVAELRAQGITYLAPSDAVTAQYFSSPGGLLRAIIEQSDGRLRLALVPLFIRHPTFAHAARSLSQELEAGLALELQTLYMAAVYLQRQWKTRLGLYLSNMTLLPDLFSQQLGLPSSEEQFGKLGLYQLTDEWQRRSRYPFDRLAALQTTIDLFFEQLKIEKRGEAYAPNR